MNNLQTPSLKISKEVKKEFLGERNYVCGGCDKAYKSYPALYLHIKRKHQGIKPPNTRCQKPAALLAQSKLQMGRPLNPYIDIDNVNQSQLDLEKVEDDLFRLMGDTLNLIVPLDPKPSVETIASTIISNLENTEDEYLIIIKQKVQEFIEQEKHGHLQPIKNVQLDFEKFRQSPPEDALMALIWFIFWFAKYTIKLEFVPNLCLICSRIWKVITQMGINLQDLDNKLVWNEVGKECVKESAKLIYFRGKDRLILDFGKKLCQYIGKSLEQQ